MSPAARFFRWLISLYQSAFSARPSPCRFVPSCSSYASEAVEVHGAVKGSIMGAWRVCRCNPWGGHGLDPVPPVGGAEAATDRRTKPVPKVRNKPCST